MKTDMTKLLARCLALTVAAALAACGGPIEELPVDEDGNTVDAQALTNTSLGVVTGAIYEGVPLSMATHGDQLTCEFQQMGAKWIRIEADWQGTSTATYQQIVQKAHARGIKVNVVVAGPLGSYCGADDQPAAIDQFIANYINRLDYLAKNVFVGTARADAFEIGNEPNARPDCGAPTAKFRVGPNAFAWLMRRVWEWKARNARPELIISGGIINTYINVEPYWASFFASGAFTGFRGSRPFDYFGIHPYNYWSYDSGCVRSGGTACWGNWKTVTTNDLKAIASRINSVTGTTGARLFATEFGWHRSQTGTCGDNSGCVLTDSQMAAGLQAAAEAMNNSLVTPFATYYNYHDDVEHYGVRAAWNGSKFPARTTVWQRFQSMAGGGTGNTNPDACWTSAPAPTYSYFPVNFEWGDARRTTSTGDWSPGNFKSECASGETLTGLSLNPSTRNTRVALCRSGDSARYPHNSCYARNITGADNRGTTATGDWSFGNIKGECRANEFVAGVSQDSSHRITAILCCPGSVAHNSCAARVFDGQDARETTASGDWDSGNWKGECGPGRYAAGLSRNPSTGRPHALLCCAP
jgi:hypothetical protein